MCLNTGLNYTIFRKQVLSHYKWFPMTCYICSLLIITVQLLALPKINIHCFCFSHLLQVKQYEQKDILFSSLLQFKVFWIICFSYLLFTDICCYDTIVALSFDCMCHAWNFSTWVQLPETCKYTDGKLAYFLFTSYHKYKTNTLIIFN